MIPIFKRPQKLLDPRQLLHSAKGTTWDEHKYIKRVDGTYYYPDSYEGGRHLNSETKKETSEKMEDWEKNLYEALKKDSNAIDTAKYDFGDLLIKYSGLNLKNVSEAEVDRMQRKIVGRLEKEAESKVSLDKNDVENLAKEVIKGNFGNGDIRKELLGEHYREIQDRVNELMKGSGSSKNLLDISESEIKAGEKEVEKVVQSSTGGMDMETVYEVYRKKK